MMGLFFTGNGEEADGSSVRELNASFSDIILIDPFPSDGVGCIVVSLNGYRTCGAACHRYFCGMTHEVAAFKEDLSAFCAKKYCFSLFFHQIVGVGYDI